MPLEDERPVDCDIIALEAVAALYDYEAEREWVSQSGTSRWFGDTPDDVCPW